LGFEYGLQGLNQGILQMIDACRIRLHNQKITEPVDDEPR